MTTETHQVRTTIHEAYTSAARHIAGWVAVRKDQDRCVIGRYERIGRYQTQTFVALYEGDTWDDVVGRMLAARR